MKLEILLSCMHQHTHDIISRSGITSDVLIINQCDKNEVSEEIGMNGQKIRMISTIERGLSRSRNMAIKNAQGDICLICDDDERFESDYNKIILNAFEKHPKADLITFKLETQHLQKKYPQYEKKIGYIGALQTASWQIAFRRESILKHQIQFDEQMGSGTGNGGGEENKFLFDCLRNGLKIWYVPQLIGSVAQTDSQWFNGFTPQFMRNQGWSSRRIMGTFWGYAYILSFIIRKYQLYKNDCGFFRALKEIHTGFFGER